MMRNRRNVTFEAEEDDVFDAFLAEAAGHKTRNVIRKMFDIFGHKAKIAAKVQAVQAQVKRTYEDKMFSFEFLQRGDAGGRAGAMEKKAPVIEEDYVGGLDHDAEKIIGWVTGGDADLRVISILGMGGIGKATLAKKVFTDPRVTNKFSTLGWIYASQNDSIRNLLLSILRSGDQDTSEGLGYLIVVDDLRTAEVLDSIKWYLPGGREGGRILLTSRNRDVAVSAANQSKQRRGGVCCYLHEMRCLSHEESWELLQKKVFGQGKCPPDLEYIGHEIVEKCRGLPLSVGLIAGMLRNTSSWEKVAKSVEAASTAWETDDYFIELLGLSYSDLPSHLKACFLYFVVFPEDYEIPVWILIRLWIAEGFIQKIENVCLEDIAEEYLEDLVGRSLVLVAERSWSGRIKTCRLHNLLRDVCLMKAKETYFFLEMKVLWTFPSSSPSVSQINHHHRFCSRIFDYIASASRSPPCVRSFLCFASNQVNLPFEDLQYIPEVPLKMVRTFHMQPTQSARFLIEIVKLVHLRYVAITGHFEILPASMSNLSNLQTLIVKTSSRTIDIQADIWKMLHLRHIHTSGASQLPNPPARTNTDHEIPIASGSLQTLSTITPESCTENVLSRNPYLKKLGISGKLATLREEKRMSLFHYISKLDHLVTLKLLNDTFPHPPKYKLRRLPQWNKFPPNLKSLTLAGTFLRWDHMSMLETLPKLEKLKLKDNAFIGTCWALKYGFPQLKVLQIWKTDLEYWEAKADHFPRLQHLVLRDCTSLIAIPFGLGDVTTLQTLKLYRTSASAAASARKILKQQQESKVYNGLKVNIFSIQWARENESYLPCGD